MDQRITDDLTRVAESLSPASVMVVCAADNPLPEAIRARLPDTPLTRLPTESVREGMTDLSRHELVFVPDALADLPHDVAMHLIASLRDLYSESLYVLLPEGDAGGWTEQDLVALGLERVHRYDTPGGTSLLFRFNIRDYKKTPDWLNPRYWANPEMWNKARW
jgi:hypothetical protein